MKRKEFIEFVRKENGILRVDDIKISTGESEIVGTGTLECRNNRFVIDVRVPEGTTAPQLKSGFVTSKDFWSLEGAIAHDLRFSIRGLPPCVSHTESNGRLTLHLDADSIELAPSGTDLISYEELQQTLEQLQSGVVENPLYARETLVPKKEQNEKPVSEVEFAGFLPGLKLIDRDEQTTITEENAFLGKSTSWKRDTTMGMLSDRWKFGLIQRDDGVEFHLRSREDFISLGEKDDLSALDAFLNALAFVHGQHAWPFTLEYRRDGRLITDRVRPFQIPAKTPHHPFTERISFNAHVNGLDWNFENALQKVFAFFLEVSAFRDEVAELLFLCREAGSDGIHGKITNISVASLLESLVNAIFEDKLLNSENELSRAFTEVRSEICECIKGRSEQQQEPRKSAFERCLRILQNTHYWHSREKFRAVVDYLGLQWEGDWESLYKFWARHRSGLVHRGSKSKTDEKSVAETFQIESRLSGAINMLVLKLMGYKGIAVSSRFEDQFKQI